MRRGRRHATLGAVVSMPAKPQVLGSTQFGALRALHFSPFGRVLREPLPPLHVLVDTTFALRAIERRATMNNAAALTHLEETVDAGVVVAYAPPELATEVDKNLREDFVEKGRVSAERATVARNSVLDRIRFFRGNQSASAAVAALRRRNAHGDVRFCEVYEHLRLDAVLSHDHDWNDTGYPVLDLDALDALGALRSYARDAAPGLVVGTAGAMTTVALSGLVSSLRRLPAPLLILGIGGLVLAGLHAGTRKKVGDALAALFDDPIVAAGVQHIASAHARLATSEKHALEVVERRRVTARIHALRAVVAGASDVGSVWTAMIVNGWRPKTDELARTVRRALRACPELEEDAQRQWSLRPAFSK